MGLTIHYGLTSKTRSAEKAKGLVERMRQLALDLPFEKVDDKVQYLGPEVCQRPLDDLRPDENLFSTVLDGCKHVDIPWHRKQRASVTVQPLEIFSFSTIPGPGSEWASFGLARYPAEIEVTYCPQDDDRFIKTIKKGGSTRGSSIGSGGSGGCNATATTAGSSPRTRNSSRSGRSRPALAPVGGIRHFCKTQYASDPECGGIPNFVRCHLCVIHLLDRIGALPTMKVEIDDEGKYGRSYYTDDPWAEERVYTWHDGKYDVKALVEEVGEWNDNDRRHVRGNQRRAQGEWVFSGVGFTDHGLSRL